jgi:hypothetical protein
MGYKKLKTELHKLSFYASNAADTTTAKNAKKLKAHQQHAHYAEAITPQTTGGANITTTC